jgi:hypothetical protein
MQTVASPDGGRSLKSRSGYRRCLNGTRACLEKWIITSALLAIYPSECHASTNFLERDFWTASPTCSPDSRAPNWQNYFRVRRHSGTIAKLTGWTTSPPVKLTTRPETRTSGNMLPLVRSTRVIPSSAMITKSRKSSGIRNHRRK